MNAATFIAKLIVGVLLGCVLGAALGLLTTMLMAFMTVALVLLCVAGVPFLVFIVIYEDDGWDKFKSKLKELDD